MRKNHNIVYSLCSLQLQHVIPYTHIISDHIISSDKTWMSHNAVPSYS